MKRETMRHPKTYDLMVRLGCSRPTALGYLTLLWDYTGEVAPQGDIGKWPDGVIAQACDWTGDATEFVEALVGARWLDPVEDPKVRLLIHDWPEHCQQFVKAKLGYAHISFHPLYFQALPPNDLGQDGSKPTERPRRVYGESTESLRSFSPLSNPIQSNPNHDPPLRARACEANPVPETASAPPDGGAIIVEKTAKDWLKEAHDFAVEQIGGEVDIHWKQDATQIKRLMSNDTTYDALLQRWKVFVVRRDLWEWKPEPQIISFPLFYSASTRLQEKLSQAISNGQVEFCACGLPKLRDGPLQWCAACEEKPKLRVPVIR